MLNGTHVERRDKTMSDVKYIHQTKPLNITHISISDLSDLQLSE